MSQSKKTKKVVVTTTKKASNKVKPTVSRFKSDGNNTKSAVSLSMNKSNYIWMMIGLALIAIGFMLMAGGHMPSADVWDDNIIYSFRRVTLAPIFILAGLGVEVYAIFKK